MRDGEQMEDLWLLGLVFAAAYLSFGSFTPLATFGDDYICFSNGMGMADWGITIGRWATVFMWGLLGGNSFNSPLSLVVGLFILTVAAILVAKLFNLKSSLNIFIVAGLFVTSPFLLDVFVFKMRHYTITFSILIAVVAVLLYWKGEMERKGWYTFAVIPLIVIAESLYPANASIMAVLIIVRAAFENSFDIGSKVKVIAKFVILGALATALYVVTVKLSLSYFGLAPVSNGTYSLVSGFITNGWQLIEAIAEVYHLFFEFLFYSNEGVPKLYSWILLLAFLGGISIAAIEIEQLDGKLFFLFLMLILPAVAMATVELRAEWPHRYSLFFPLGLLPVVVLAGYLQMVETRQQFVVKKSLCQLGLVFSILIAVFSNATEVFQSNEGWQKDLLYANRVLYNMKETKTYEGYARANRLTPVAVMQSEKEIGFGSSDFHSIGYSLHSCHILEGCQANRLVALLNRINGESAFQLMPLRKEYAAETFGKGIHEVNKQVIVVVQ